MLLPLSGEVIRGNQAPEARLDVSAIGFWRPQERMFADVRVFEPNCVSYKDLEPAKVYARHEQEKKREYNDRLTLYIGDLSTKNLEIDFLLSYNVERPLILKVSLS